MSRGKNELARCDSGSLHFRQEIRAKCKICIITSEVRGEDVYEYVSDKWHNGGVTLVMTLTKSHNMTHDKELGSKRLSTLSPRGLS